ncbi:hypothetical protein EFL99_10110 [Lactococcus lactis]|uniref:ABC-three component system middle component 2 n=1 Tax=Lactococcus lactis TaxID=1358 RepID=UPI00223B36BC|nr:ABC-three component system middle component 2 [Lactococcus lactis]MCT1183583.1 hypothetical protein [Lactococcus lactis]
MNKLELINSPLETALRIIIILSILRQEIPTLDEIVMLDYYVLHANDFDPALESIHPDIPNRENELLIRRKLVIEGLRILESRSLIKINYTKTGIRYCTNELSNQVVKYLESPYSSKVTRNISESSTKSFDEIMLSVRKLITEDSNIWINKL